MRKYLILISIFFYFASCDNDILSEANDGIEAKTETNGDIMLQERDRSRPVTLFKIRPTLRYGGDFKEPDSYLGYSYDYGESVEGNEADAKEPVIDMARLKAKYPSYITPKRLRQTYSSSSAWSSYDKFHRDSSVIKKVNSGFQLNVGIFKIGKKKKTTETFRSVLTTENESTIGEVTAEVRHGMFTLTTTDVVTKRIAAEYLDETFLSSLYNKPVEMLLKENGTFVLTSYFTGGRASASYYGITSSSTSDLTKTKDMEKNLDASFAWKPKNDAGNLKGDSISGSLNFGRKRGDSLHIQQIGSIKEVYFQVNTIGGLYDHSISSNISNVKDVNYDLTPWLKSLNDESLHQMIDIADNGLQPLSSFVLETNFKQRIQDTHLGYLTRSELAEPFIEVVKVRAGQASNGEALFDVFAVLNTRQGDKIVLSDGKTSLRSETELRANLNDATYLTKAKAIAAQKRKYFAEYEIDIKANYSTKIMPLNRNPLCIELKAIDESKMMKFTNANTNMVYLYDPVNRVAFAYHAPDGDDYIPASYGISEWVENMTEKSISMTTLYQRYTIIGL